MSAYRLPILVSGLLAVAACAAAGEDQPGEEASASEDAITSVARPDVDPSVLVKDPATLVALEPRFSFAAMLGARGQNAAEVHAASAAYRSLAAAVTSDVEATRAADPASGKGFAFAHRLFDDGWLRSREVRFELTGITNRIDLRHRGGCGEVHFVYRLGYTTQSDPNVAATKIDSRLPFTVNVLVPIADDGAQCANAAQRWLEVLPGSSAGAIAGGPLAGLARPSRVEIDYQLVRWPSSVRPDLGGHAEYQLRAFAFEGADLREVPLEDTPRADLDATERGALKTWIGENLRAIDDGTARVPERFLARTIKSVSPRSSVRLGNHPFSALFAAADVADLPLPGTATVRSPKALLHKLDGMTCNGCHQSRGLAGFHLLGEERAGTARLNALAVGASPHLLDAARFRKAFVEAVAQGRATPRRGAADHVAGAAGGFGDHCSLGADPGFAGWSCKDGLACKEVDDDALGACLADTERPGAGDACETSRVTASADPHRDRVSNKRTLACAGGIHCVASSAGFPDGLCETRCNQLGRVTGDTVCSGMPFGTGPLGGFNTCLFERHRPFQECLADDVRPTLTRACDEARPCRDDYACVRVFLKPKEPGDEVTEEDPDVGACMPPYFVFQGRVDGHVLYGR